MVRTEGFEPSTPRLRAECSTTELRPQIFINYNVFWRPQRDSNSRPLVPKTSALNPLSYGGKSNRLYYTSVLNAKMIIMEKAKKYFPYIYTILLLFSFLYVQSVLKEGDIRNYDDDVEKAVKEHPVNVTLVVEDKSYFVNLASGDTVLDLLEDLRGDDLFNYEVTGYTYGTELDTVNGIKPSEGYKWKLYKENEDITNTIGDVFLTDETTYTIKMVKD